MDENSSYDFQIYIRDQLNTLSGVNLYFTVPQGTPLIALRKKKICINTPTPDAALNRALKQGAAVLAKEARHVVGRHFHRPCAAHADGSRMLRADSAAVRECFRRHKPRRYSHRSAPAGSVHFKPLARDSQNTADALILSCFLRIFTLAIGLHSANRYYINIFDENCNIKLCFMSEN